MKTCLQTQSRDGAYRTGWMIRLFLCTPTKAAVRAHDQQLTLVDPLTIPFRSHLIKQFCHRPDTSAPPLTCTQPQSKIAHTGLILDRALPRQSHIIALWKVWAAEAWVSFTKPRTPACTVLSR